MVIKRKIKLAIILFFGMILPVFFFAQSFTATVNKKVIPMGEYFEIRFTINATASNFQPPDLKDFNVYQGPNQSSNMSWVNGVVTQSISLSYYLGGKKEGKFTIGPASIVVSGKKLLSNAVAIEIVKGNAPANQNQNQTQNQTNTNPQRNEYSNNSGGNDVFVKTLASKQKCYLGEQIVVTHKIYARNQIKTIQNLKLPSYTGFWNKEEDRNKQSQLETENVDGIMYYVVEFNKTFLFPQRTGELEIDPVEIDVITAVQSRNRPRNIIEQLIGGGYEDKVNKLKSKPVKITVNALPEANKPADFNGAVGSFNFKAELDRDKVKENDAINLKITISGRGNINLIDNPKIKFPSEFETYDPKVNENISVNAAVSGSKTFEYLLIPRKRGQYTIKDFNFSYFDHEKN
ncbi:MAG: protein BatD, partial [Bacteroidia bacterium]|nr:protein BatD [Bacteroidia bacterium]